MAGLVCQLPPLNKKGPGNAGFNLDEQTNSINKFKVLVDAAVAKWRTLPRTDAAAKEGLSAWPFVPISISRAALDRLFTSGTLKADFCDGYPRQAGAPITEVLGCCSNAANNVLMEFVMRPLLGPTRPPAGEWWTVYHRQIWIQTQPGSFEPYLAARPGALTLDLKQADPEQKLSRLKVVTEGKTAVSTDAAGRLDKLRTLWATRQKATLLPSSLPTDSAFPVGGTQNPYLTYPDGDPRNAVSGDYDLFAFWPRTLETRWQETVRYSEFKSPPQTWVPARLPALFRAVRRRQFTVELTQAPSIRLEVIPGFDEIKAWEDAVLGNINDAVGLAVGTLNAFITHVYDRQHCGRETPNAAFHSDEGGRPGVNEIEYPVAVFLPEVLRLNTAEGAVVLSDHAQFLDLLERLNDRCELPLNFGWLIHLLADLATPEQLRAAMAVPGRDAKTQKAVVEYISKRLESQSAAGLDLLALRSRTAALLTGRPKAWDEPAARAAFQDACATFIAVACLQIDPKTPVAAMVKRILDGEPAP